MTPGISEKLFTHCVRNWLQQDLRPLEFTAMVETILQMGTGDNPVATAAKSVEEQIEEWYARKEGWVTGPELTAELAPWNFSRGPIPVNLFKLIRRVNDHGPEADLTHFTVEMGDFSPKWHQQGFIPSDAWQLHDPSAGGITIPRPSLIRFLEAHGSLVVPGLCQDWCGPDTKINLDGDEWHSCEDWVKINSMIGNTVYPVGGKYPTNWQLLTGDYHAGKKLKEAGALIVSLGHLSVWGRFGKVDPYALPENDPAVIAAVTQMLKNL